MRGATYVQRHKKTGVYWFRRKVPADLIPMIGRGEIIKSLTTKDLNDAKRRSRKVADIIDDLFDAASVLSQKGMMVESRLWSDTFIEQRLIHSPHGTAGGDRATGESSSTSDTTQPPKMPSALPEQPQTFPRIPQRVATVRELFDNYIGEFERRPKTERTWRVHLNMFLQVNGLTMDTLVHTVTDAQVENFALILRRLPARRQGRTYAGLSPTEIAQRFCDRDDIPKLDAKSIKNKVDSLRAIFNYAVRFKYRQDNPFSGVTSTRGTKRLTAQRKRLPFDSNDIMTIFGSKAFQVPTHLWGGRQWIAVIGLYTGARLEEIGQLRVADFRFRATIPIIMITTAESDGDATITDSTVRGKVLKTASSEREIPLHPALVDLGLVKHIQRMKHINETRIFPDIHSNQDVITAGYSKWFGRYLNKIGITSPTKVFHSFRHSYKDACRNCGVPKEITEAIMGHTGQTVGDTYGSGYSVSRLATEIAKVSYGLHWEMGHTNEISTTPGIPTVSQPSPIQS